MKIIHSSIRFNKVLLSLIFSHSFLVITVFGNLIILTFSSIFYLMENEANQSVNSFFDAIWWGFTTATTVGYGDIIPITFAGKIVGILTMLIGTALFATFTALFARTILEDEFFRLKMKIENVEDEHDDYLSELKKHREHIDKQIRKHEKI